MGTNKDTCGIYGIWCRENGKWYVGASKHVRKRVKEHKGDHRRAVRYIRYVMRFKSPSSVTAERLRYPFAADVVDYGWDAFEASFLEEVPDPADLQERERYWIDALNAKENGYNKSASGGHWRWGE